MYMRKGSRRVKRFLVLLLSPVLDIVLPLPPQSERTKSRSISDLTLKPTTHRLLKIDIVTLLSYNDEATRDAIRALKFENLDSAAELLAHALADYLYEEILSLRAFSPRPILLIPVPLHRDRLRERGFNQIERVLEYLPAHLRDGSLARTHCRSLRRVRATPHQTKLTRQARLKNIRGAFEADKSILKNTHVIVVDDVVTTGATLAECAKIIQKTGATVTCLALARA